MITPAKDRTRDWQAWEKWITRECEGTGEAADGKHEEKVILEEKQHFSRVPLPFANQLQTTTCTAIKVPPLQSLLTKCQVAAILGTALTTTFLFLTLWAHELNSHSRFTRVSVYVQACVFVNYQKNLRTAVSKRKKEYREREFKSMLKEQKGINEQSCDCSRNEEQGLAGRLWKSRMGDKR